MGYFIWTIVFLLVCAYTDVREKYVYRQVCLVNIAAVVLIKVLDDNKNIKSVAIGVLVGCVIYLISCLTKEKIGKGDALVIANIGGLLGAATTVTVLAWALALGSIFGVGGMALKRINARDSIAFVPFLLMGTIITYIVI